VLAGDAPSAHSCSHLPRKLPGEVGCRGLAARRRASRWRPRGAPPPDPLPRCRGRGGEFECAAAGIGLRPPGAPPPSFLGERGEFDCAPTASGRVNLPQQFWGRWASHASPEGALPFAPHPPKRTQSLRGLYPLPLAGEGASLSERVRAPRGRRPRSAYPRHSALRTPHSAPRYALRTPAAPRCTCPGSPGCPPSGAAWWSPGAGTLRTAPGRSSGGQRCPAGWKAASAGC
jgi:hypothetical protein